MMPTDVEPNNFHFRPKHKHHVVHREGVSQLNETLSFVPLGHVSRRQEPIFWRGILRGATSKK